MTAPQSSTYVVAQAKAYSMYVMTSRAIPNVTDGLKAGGRRVLWTARDGKKWKAASLAGATMPIHPHSSPEGAINTLAAQYGNNVPLFKGESAFGTLLTPKEYSAPRYTTVSASLFAQDVIFKDIEIIPMTENYDGTLQEPVHFLPLVPVVLINPAEGVAVGFSTNILPRALDDIIMAQLAHLAGKTFSAPLPKFLPLENYAHAQEPTDGGVAYYFNGEYTQKDTSSITITKLPYGQAHEKVMEKIRDLIEKDVIHDYEDGSKDVIHIDVKFSRGYLKTVQQADVLRMLGLSVRHIEHLNVLNFDGTAVWVTDAAEIIKQYTDWRLKWYVTRYERLRDLLAIDLQRYYDIRSAIKNNVGGLAKKIQTRAELKDVLTELKIISVDYIADLPIYRFTEEEYQKNEARIEAGERTMKQYLALLSSEDERRKVYVAELQEVLSKYTKGLYNE